MARIEEDSVDIVFHGVPYNLAITVAESAQPEPTLAVDLEQLDTGAAWHGEFSASYVENITSKTGSFKRFPVLVKMLMGALRQQTETVFLDLLTYADLEALRNRKIGKAGNDAATAAPRSGAGNNKRYLILTYIVEFDRVHYPLPLVFEEAPTVPALQRLASRLRRDLLAYKSLAGLNEGGPGLTAAGVPASAAAALTSSVAGLQRENSILRQMLQERNAKDASAQEAIRSLQIQVAGMADAASAGETAIEKLRAASRAEVKRLRQEVAELKARLGDAEAAATAAADAALVPSASTLRREGELITGLRESNEQLKGRVQELTRQLALAMGSSHSAGVGRGRQPASGAPTSRGSTGGQSRRSTTPTSRTGSVGRSPAAGASRGVPSSRNPTPSRVSTGTTAAAPASRYSRQSSASPSRGGMTTPGSTASGPRAGANYGNNGGKGRSGTPTGINRQTTPGGGSARSVSSATRGGAAQPMTATRGRSTTPSGSVGGGRGRSPMAGAAGGARGVPAATARAYGYGGGGGGTTTPTGARSVSVSSHRSAGSAGRANTNNSNRAGQPGSSSLSGAARPSNATSSPRLSVNTASATTSVPPFTARSTSSNSIGGGGITGSTPRGGQLSTTSAGGEPKQPAAGGGSTVSPYLTSVAPMLAHVDKTYKQQYATGSTPRAGSVSAGNSVVIANPSSSSSAGISEPPALPRQAWAEGDAVGAQHDGGGGSSARANGDAHAASSSAAAAPASVSPPASSRPASPRTYDSSAEISDIDTRLQQLQDFLKAAKTGAPLPQLTVTGAHSVPVT